MRELENNYNVRTFYEIFHMNEAIIHEHLELGFGSQKNKEDNFIHLGFPLSGIRDFALNDPARYLDGISSMSVENNFVFKIFPNHLKNKEQINSVLSTVDHVVFLLRNPFHSYISNKISTQTGIYANASTGGKKVVFDEVEFVWWNNHIFDFFESVKAALLNFNVNVSFSTYEGFFYLDGKKNFIESLGLKSRDVNMMFQPSLKQQDSRNLASLKVSNPSSLLKFMDVHNMQHLDDVTVPIKVGDFKRISND